MEHFKINNLMIKYFLIIVFSFFLITCFGQDYIPSDGWVSPDNQKIYRDKFSFFDKSGVESVTCGDLKSDKVDLKSYRRISLYRLSADVIDTSVFTKLINLETLFIEPGGSSSDGNMYPKNLNLLGSILPKMTSLKYIHVLHPNDAFLEGMSQLSSLETIIII